MLYYATKLVLQKMKVFAYLHYKLNCVTLLTVGVMWQAL
jgi:hypothetical protein